MHPFMLFAQEAGTPLDLGLRIPLSVMMFLEFAIWGAWFVVLGNYLNSLNFSRTQIARVYSTDADRRDYFANVRRHHRRPIL